MKEFVRTEQELEQVTAWLEQRRSIAAEGENTTANDAQFWYADGALDMLGWLRGELSSPKDMTGAKVEK